MTHYGDINCVAVHVRKLLRMPEACTKGGWVTKVRIECSRANIT